MPKSNELLTHISVKKRLIYSYSATLQEIAENDYNLNIPRYVDTFEEEEPIDLEQVQQDLKNIDKEIAQVEQEINAYLKELGVLKDE